MKDILAKQKVVEPSANLGATYLEDNRCRFLVWAPQAEEVEVRLVSPKEELVPLELGERGYFSAVVAGVEPGCRYFYRLQGSQNFPDPARILNHHGRLGPPPTMKFLVGAVREPSPRGDLQGKMVRDTGGNQTMLQSEEINYSCHSERS
jgi:hypothetical protein